jgi:raffinose/stachyose/melibiose transport system substrate-binding protein
MKRQKVSAWIALTAMACGILAGCNSSNTESSNAGSKGTSQIEPEVSGSDNTEKNFEGTTLTMWMGSGENQEGTQAVLQKATEALGIEFEIEINPGGTEGDNILKTRCASGELPDITNWNSGSKFLSLNPKEYFMDLGELEVADKLDEAFVKAVSQDGTLLGVPFGNTQAGAIVYWKPDYEELGLEVPKTWDAFLENCKALQDAGKTPIYLSGGDTWTTQVLFLGDYYNIYANEPDFADEFTKGNKKFATSEAGTRSWKKYEDLVGLYNEDATAAKYEDGIEAMAQGEASHWIILTQVLGQMVTNHPDAAEKIGVFAVPGDNPENNGMTVWQPNGWYVNKNTDKKDAALAFLNFWYREDMLDLYINTYGTAGPSCIKGYELPDSVIPAVREDMQQYFNDGKIISALEFLTNVKGASCEQITSSVALGQITGEEAAAMYDDDCKKSALQLGLDWN